MFSKKLNTLNAAIFHKAIKFFTEKLKLDTYATHTPIVVKIVDNIARGTVAGTCSPTFSPNMDVERVDIEIKHQATLFGMIEALAHEMVHAKQFLKGEQSVEFTYKKIFGILPIPTVKRIWKGCDVTHLSYYDSPSEQEAHTLQKSLTFEYLKSIEEDLCPINLFLTLKTTTDSICNSDNNGGL